MSNSQIDFKDKKDAPTIKDIEEHYSLVKSMSSNLDKLENKQTKASLRIKDSGPVGIVFTGDWHIGARGVQYDLLDRDLDLIRDTEGCYAIGMGDYKDNQNSYVHPNGVVEEVNTPSKQDLLVKYLMTRVGKDKWIALVRGCHDDWDKKLSDQDFIQDLSEELNCINLWHGGRLSIDIGLETYTIIARHKYKFESSLNTTNPHRNLVNNFGYYDIVALAHRHYPDLQVTQRMGKELIYLRSGTYKYYDEFGQKIGGYEGTYGTPMVILFPDCHKKLVVPDLELGVKVLKDLRK